jgi:hypothetical protein
MLLQLLGLRNTLSSSKKSTPSRKISVDLRPSAAKGFAVAFPDY